MLKGKYRIFFLFFFLIGFTVNSQSRKQLESQRKKLNSEISKVNKLLVDVKKQEKNALVELEDLNKKIAIRAKLIETIELESTILSKDIGANQKELEVLNTKLSNLKKDYADMIFKSYKSKSQQSRAMFLLSSKNFYQAYKRLEYMKQYTSYRKSQGEEIVKQSKVVEQINDSLLKLKQIKDTLINSQAFEKNQIEADFAKQKELVATIKDQEGKYKRELKKKLSEEKKISAKIDKIIREAIARANKKSKSTSKKKNEFILSPEAKALAANFVSNKGRLPRPVKEGLIVRRFGVQPHPTIAGITVNSTGIHFATPNGATANCIFNGKVLAVQVTSEGRKNVLVQHGNYITAYNNLVKTYVKTGDSVKTGQQLGQIFTDKVTGKTTLIFVLFKNTTRLNPSSWIL